MPTPPRKRLVWIKECDIFDDNENGIGIGFYGYAEDASDLLEAAESALPFVDAETGPNNILRAALRKGQS